MGNQVTRVYGYLVKRPLQRFNVDNRAEKMIDKFEDPVAKPHRAPMYKSDADLLEEVRRENPQLLDTAMKKDEELYDRLKSVYVSSTDPAPDPRAAEKENRPLPRDVRQHYQDFVPAQMRVERDGYLRNIPRGKISLDQAVELLSKHSETHGSFGAEEISDKYRINKDVADNIVHHFKIFSMMETETREETDKPDPLQAGPDWVSTSKLEDPMKEQLERAEEILRKEKKHELRALDERKTKGLTSGEEKS